MRLTILLCCLALASCADSGREVALSPEPAAAARLSPGAAGRAAHASAKKPDRKDGKNEDWWKEGGVTREKINAMCWMKYESGRKDMPVEKRADLVDVCVQQTLKEHPLR